jgi:predicted transcriptional regulator
MTEAPFDAIDVPIEEWQVCEILSGIADVETGKVVSHDRVSKWLRSWGTPSEGKAPR